MTTNACIILWAFIAAQSGGEGAQASSDAIGVNAGEPNGNLVDDVDELENDDDRDDDGAGKDVNVDGEKRNGESATAEPEPSFTRERPRRTEHPDEIVTTVDIAVDRARDGEEDDLEHYLHTLIGRPATQEVATEAESRLLKVGRYRAAVCRLWSKEKHKGRLRCGVSRARTIRRVHVDGLPIQLLETDLRKRVFLRAGEILDQKDAVGRDRVTRQRLRIEEYLERLGYAGARVDIVTPPVSDEADVDVEIKIVGGAFVYVHDVVIDDPGPMSAAALDFQFRNLCLNVEGSLEALERLTFSCLTRERMLAAREEAETTLRQMGHPEGRVVVSSTILDPTADETPVACRRSEEEQKRAIADRIPIPPRCASIQIKVRAGPRLITDIVVEKSDDDTDLRVVDDRTRAPIFASVVNPIASLVRGLFRSARGLVVEPGSRALQFVLSNDVRAARDTVIYLSELEERLSFVEGGSTDDEEVEESRRRLLDALALRGRFLAEVTATRVATKDEVRVTFRIAPGPPVAVSTVRFVGNRSFTTERLLDEVSLNAKVRGLLTPGFIGRPDLDDDAYRLMEFYEEQGFQEANVTVESFLTATGDVEVHFFVDEGERFVLAGLVMEGGIDALTPQVLSTIAHCRNGRATQLGRSPMVVDDCIGSAFLPDEFEADQTRVLNVYVANGYPYTRVRVEPDFNEAGPLVRISIDSVIDDDADGVDDTDATRSAPKAVHLGEVFIDGNDKTERTVMLRELALDGDVLEPAEIAVGVSRLRRTGLFNKVAVDYIGVEERDETVHLRLQVEERPTLTYDTSLAFSTNRLFSIRNEVRERNLLGRMLDLSLLADIGMFIGRYSIIEPKLRWPRLFGWPFWLNLTPAVIYEDRPGALVSREPGGGGATTAVASWAADDLRRRNLKLLNTLSVEFRPPGVDLNIGIDYELRLEWDDPNGQTLDPFSLEPILRVDGLVDVIKVQPFRVSTFKPRISYRNLDNPFDPLRGISVDASFRFGSPIIINDEWLAIPHAGIAGYWSFDRITLAGRLRGWTAYALGAPRRRSVALQQDLVAVGGDRTVRGYLQDRIGVADLPARAAVGEDVTVDGHLALLGGVANAEVRYTLVRGLFIGDLKVAGFVDAGFVTNNDVRLLDSKQTLDVMIDRDRPRLGIGVGVGVRYVLPVGPLSLDVACSPLPRPMNEQCAAHLQLGYAF